MNRRTKSRFLARPFDFAQGRLSPCIARLRTARNDNFGDCGGMAEAVPFPSPPSRFVSAVPPGLTRSQAYPGLASWAVIFPPLRGCAASLSAPQWTSRSKVEVRIRARLFSGAFRPNDELEGAGWRAKAPAPHGHHPSVCTSTESTAGRSRTIGFQLSPASAEAYTWPPVVPK